MTGESPDVLPMRATIERYFAALDNRQFELLRDVFTPDAIGDWRGEAFTADTILQGVDSIIERVSKVSRFTASTHIGGSSAFQVDSPPDTPTVVTHAVSFLKTSGESPRVIVRGVRYEDNFILTGGGWRIHHRMHQPTWQYAQPAEIADLSNR
jgi:hypothetical protein